MSVHPSLKSKGNIVVKRNVLKRYERVDTLKKQGKYEEGQKIWGLPKLRTQA